LVFILGIYCSYYIVLVRRLQSICSLDGPEPLL